MESLYILIPLAFVFVCLAVAVFFWAVKSGQFDDLDTEGKRILFDEKPVSADETAPKKSGSDSRPLTSEKTHDS